MKNLIKRKPKILLPLSIRFAKEYLDLLCKMQSDIANVQESEKLSTIHRALWTALIIEVARLINFLIHTTMLFPSRKFPK